MKLNPEEVRNAWTWFFCAGILAIGLSAFLQISDFRLSTSPRERILGNTLYELRLAQTSVKAGAVDPRLSK